MTDEGASLSISGTFWSAGGPRRDGQLVEKDSQFRVITQGSVRDSAGVAVERGDGWVSMSFSGHPRDVVTDSTPASVFGRLEDGRDITLLDGGIVPMASLGLQVIEGSRLFVGGHIESAQSPLQAARISLEHHQRWVQLAEPSSRTLTLHNFDGVLSIYSEGEVSWIELRGTPGLTDGEWERRFWYRVLNLLTTWAGVTASAARIQLRIRPDDPWCERHLRKTAPARAPVGQDRLLPPAALSVDMLINSLVKFESWGSIAEKASQRLVYLVPLQFAVIGYAAALEGLHRRCFDRSRPFPGLSRKMASQVTREAARAASDEAVRLGEVSASAKAFENAFRFFNEPNFADRIAELVEPVQEIAPGLFGDDIDWWINQLKQARNGEAHQLEQDSGRDYEAEIDNLYQLGVSGEWALRLSVLLQLGVSTGDLQDAVINFRQFEYALANMDRSRFAWPGSRLETFKAAR